jgi:hypothetical protein
MKKKKDHLSKEFRKKIKTLIIRCDSKWPIFLAKIAKYSFPSNNQRGYKDMEAASLTMKELLLAGSQ